MKSKYFYFLTAAVSLFIVLINLNYSPQKIALLQLEKNLLQETSLNTLIEKSCNQVLAQEDNMAERFFLERFSTATAKITDRKQCTLNIQNTNESRFHLITYWYYGITLHNQEGNLIFNKQYSFNFPKPLSLFPMGLFFLSLLFKVKLSLVFLMSIYGLFLFGLNTTQFSKSILKASWLTLTQDPYFIGVTLLALWAAIKLSLKQEKLAPVKNNYSLLKKVFVSLLGMWSPIFYSFVQNLFYKARTQGIHLIYNTQAILFALSIYFIFFDLKKLSLFLNQSLWLPRYFTFALLLFFFARYGLRSPHSSSIGVDRSFILSFILIFASEILFLFIPELRMMNSFARMALILLITEILFNYKRITPLWLKTFIPCTLSIFGLFLFYNISTESGILELAFTLWDPRVHPSVLTLYTFICGAIIGYLTGNVSITYFLLYTSLVKIHGIPTAKAALVDGVILGNLISPFSLLNVIPAFFNKKSIQEIISTRLRLIYFPLIISVITYALCSLQAVSILQPVSFIFLCLVLVAYMLKKNNWQIKIYGRHSFKKV